MEASWSCVAPFGRFVEIGLKDAYLSKSLPMHTFTRNVSFFAVDMDSIFSRRSHHRERLLIEVFDLFAQGILKVARPHLYSLGEFEAAFRYLQSGKSSGKLVVEVGTEDVLPVRLCSLAQHDPADRRNIDYKRPVFFLPITR